MSLINSITTLEDRAEALLSQMTLEEKIGQMCQVPAHLGSEDWIRNRHVGSLLNVAEGQIAKLQEIALREKRLGIPLLIAVDAIHGHCFHDGATVFPTQLALASSWNREMLETVARITAREATATGINWTFSPVLCLGRDHRWGRTGETFGEDPYLAALLGEAMVRGYQGNDLADPDSILACAKHFIAHGESAGGRDSAEVTISIRSLFETFLPPFRRCAEAGVGTFMAAYQSVNGEPCSASRGLLRELLKG